ncbi:hypothetical protein AB0I53_00365 [Saccharopolyspora sp. NPDC050389]
MAGGVETAGGGGGGAVNVAGAERVQEVFVAVGVGAVESRV